MRNRLGRRLAFALVVLFAGVLASAPGSASAEAVVEWSDPRANTLLPDTPVRVTVRFTEPLEESDSSSLRLLDQLGDEVPGVERRFDTDDAHIMTLDIPGRLTPGTYTVLWTTTSRMDDGVARGYFAFTVGTFVNPGSVVPPPIVAEPGGAPAWLAIAGRWIGYAGLSLAVAVWPLWLMVMRPAIAPAWQAGPRLTRRVRLLGLAGIGVAVAGLLVSLVVEAMGLERGEGLAEDILTTLTDTRYGRVWVLGVILLLTHAIVLMGAAWWWPRRLRGLTLGAIVLSALLPLPYALSSHASSEETGRATAIAFHHLHMLAASLWAGGVLLLAGAMTPTLKDLTSAGRRVVLSALLPRFSAMTVTTWGVILFTGLYAGWLQVGSADALRETAYGASLRAKLLLLLPLLILATVRLLVIARGIKRASSPDHAQRWSARFGVVVSAEAALILAVLLIAGRMTTEEPAREALALERSQTDLVLTVDGRPAALSIAPGQAGPNHFRLQVTGESIPLEAEALLRVTPTGIDAGLHEIPLNRVFGNAWETHGTELSIAGDWSVEVVVLGAGADPWTAATSLFLNPPTLVEDDAGPPLFSTGGIVGLLMIAIGFGGFAFAWWVGRGPLRKEGAAIGGVAIALGLLLLMQARTTAGGVPLTAANPIPPTDASIARGEQVFLANCAECHGVSGRGDGPLARSFVPPAADFTAGHTLAHLDGEFFNWIKGGKPPTAMPAFGDELSDEQIWDVVNYLREIQRDVRLEMPAAVASPVASDRAP